MWATYGWGSLEYSSGTGSVLGGRWKPSHYMLKNAYSDVIAACGADARCFVKNDGALTPLDGVTLNIFAVRMDGTRTPLLPSKPVTLPVGANAIEWFCADGKVVPPAACAPWSSVLPTVGCAGNGTDCVLSLSVTTGDGELSYNTQLLTVPGHLSMATDTRVTLAVGAEAPDGSIPITITVTGSGPALFVTLFTLANGRFSDNALPVMFPGMETVQFLPFLPGQAGALASSLRVDHLAKFFSKAA